jgi:hypothetical protein
MPEYVERGVARFTGRHTSRNADLGFAVTGDPTRSTTCSTET